MNPTRKIYIVIASVLLSTQAIFISGCKEDGSKANNVQESVATIGGAHLSKGLEPEKASEDILNPLEADSPNDLKSSDSSEADEYQTAVQLLEVNENGDVITEGFHETNHPNIELRQLHKEEILSRGPPISGRGFHEGKE